MQIVKPSGYFNTAIIKMSFRHGFSDLAHDKTIRDHELLCSTFIKQERTSVIFINVAVKEIPLCMQL
jgi:hypothetical protein